MVILRALDLDEDINENLLDLDPEEEGLVHLSDIVARINMKIRKKWCENDLRRAFQLMDGNGKGFISFDDLKRINEEIAERMSDAELQEMMEEADFEDLGVVTEDNFVKFMTKAQEDSIACNCPKFDN